MTWVKLDDGFFDHPKVLTAGPDAARFYLAALCWCSQQATDGLIPAAAVAIIGAKVGATRPMKLVEALLDVGLFETDPRGPRIHDYCDHQRTRSQRDSARDSARDRQRTSRERRAMSHRSSVAEEELETDVLEGQPTSQWGANWRPRESSAEWAFQRFSEFQIRRQTERFIEFNTKRGTEFRDVDAAWRAWMRRELPAAVKCDMPKGQSMHLCGQCDAPLLPGLDGELECSAGCEAIIIDLAATQ